MSDSDGRYYDQHVEFEPDPDPETDPETKIKTPDSTDTVTFRVYGDTRQDLLDAAIREGREFFEAGAMLSLPNLAANRTSDTRALGKQYSAVITVSAARPPATAT